MEMEVTQSLSKQIGYKSLHSLTSNYLVFLAKDISKDKGFL